LTKLRLVATAVVAAAVIAGCGGGDSNKTLSYSDMSAQANQICNDVNPEIKSLSQKLTGKAATDAPVLDQVIPKLDAAIGRFKDLKPPDELKPDYDRFISTSEAQIELDKNAQAAAKSGNQTAYDAALKTLKASTFDSQNDEAASKLGAKACIG
jgi:TolA-binding protein